MPDKLAVIQSQETISELEKIDTKIGELIVSFNKLVDVSGSVGKNISTPKELLATEKARIQIEKEYLAFAEKKAKIENQIEAAQKRRTEATEKQRLSEIKLQQDREKAFDNFDKNLLKEEQAVRKLNSAYEQLNRDHDEARKKAKDMAATHGILSREFLKAAAEANAYDQKLKRIDVSLGQFNRNVGNYHGNMFGLNAQMAQVMREMPNFAMDARIGIMSLTNNLPYLADAISDVNQQSKALKQEFKDAAALAYKDAEAKALAAGANRAAAKAAGEAAEALVMQNYQAAKAPSILKQIASSIFSWQSLLIVGITLLMQYNKEIIAFTKSVFNGGNVIKSASEIQKDYNEIKKEGVKNAAQEIAQSEILYRTMTNEALSRESRWKAAKKLQDLYPSYFGNMSIEDMMVGKAIDKYNLLRKAILDSARARAIGDKLTERQGELLVKEEANKNRMQQLAERRRFLQNNPNYTETRQGASVTGSGGALTPTFYEVGVKELLRENALEYKRYYDSVIKDKKDFNRNNKVLIDEQMRLESDINVQKYQADKSSGRVKIPGEKEDKKNKGSRLTDAQRDYLNELQAIRDNEIAAQKQFRMDGKITEEQYWQEYIKIVKKYRDAVSDYLTGKNGKEKAIEAATRRRAIEEIEKANKEIFDYEFKQNEENHKIKINQLETQQKEIAANDYITNTDRLAQQIDLDNKMIEESRLYWHTQIELAKAAHQDTLELERKRDEELNKYQLQRQKNAEGGIEAVNADVKNSQQFENSIAGESFANKRLAIMKSRLSIAEKEYRLSLLQKEEEQDSLIRQQNDLEYQKTKYEAQVELTLKQRNELAAINAELAEIGVRLQENKDATIEINAQYLIGSLIQPFSELLNANGFTGLADQIQQRWMKMFKDLKDGALDWKDVTALAVSAVADIAAQANERQYQNRIAALDEELRASQNATEQEIGFIEKRIEWMNSLGDLSKEQIVERNALEDEARALREQQLQREKMIATQKAKAEQRAAAQQALIQGLLGAAKSIPNWAQVAASVAAGALMAGLIMSKDPTPKYFVGRKGGKAEWAWTQEKGREIITDRQGNIKDFGSDNGAKMTWLDAGDNVLTADETAKILANTPDINYSKIAKDSLRMPMFISNTPDNSEKIIEGVGSEFDRVMKKYDKTHIFENEKGEIFKQTGGQIPVKIGRKRKSSIDIKVRRNDRRD